MRGGINLDDIVKKIHQLNTVFSKSATTVIPLDGLCDELCGIIGCNIYLFDPAGHIFAYSVAQKYLCAYTKCSLENQQLPQYYMDLFNNNNVNVTDLHAEHPECTYADVKHCLFSNRHYSIYPIFSGFKKVAGILFIRYETPFSESDKILCEYTCAIVSIEMLRQEQERIQQFSMEIAKAKLAVSSLTYSEKKAACSVLEEIRWDEGEVYLNSVANKTYTTPSTVSGALKKLELATMIDTKSMGVKGKYIKILNHNLRSELKQSEGNPRAVSR